MSTVPLDTKTLLLSIHPRYCDLILSGSKTVELRKQRPKLPSGSLVVMYASSPICALVGAFVLDGVVCTSPADLWRRYGPRAGVEWEVFERYYAEREQAFGLLVGDVMPFEEVVSLDALRRSWGKFHPPQSYRYVYRTRAADGLRLTLPGGTRALSTRFGTN